MKHQAFFLRKIKVKNKVSSAAVLSCLIGKTIYFFVSFSIHAFICSHICVLTLKAPITNAADDIRKYFFIVFQRK